MEKQLKASNATTWVTAVLFIIYLLALYWILLLKLGVDFSYMGERRANLIPFGQSPILDSQNIMNVVIFVPLGIYAGIVFQNWSAVKRFLFVFFVSLMVEGLQYILRLGGFDVTDIITNTTGGVIGLMVFKAIEKAFNNRVTAQQFINIFAAIGTVFMVVLLVLLKMNMLPIRYQ